MVGVRQPPCETPEGFPPQGRDPRWVLPAAILGSSLGFIDSSVVNVALPQIQAQFQTGLTTSQWIINGYMLTLASLILLGGAAGDRFGQRRMFLAGLVGFTVTSIACGLAPTSSILIVARVVQGASAALLVPSSLALIGSAYSGESRARAIGTWAAASALTTALGPPVGGWLVDTVGWRSIFFISVPVATLAFVFGRRIARDTIEEGTSQSLDVVGAALATLCFGLVCYGLIQAGEGATLTGSLAIAAAVPVALLFLLAERRESSPMVPPGLFANRDFSAANLLTFIFYASLTGSLFLIPFVLINVYDYTAAAAGAAFLPFAVIMGLGSRGAGTLAERLGARSILMAGPMVTAFGYAALATSAHHGSYWFGFFPGLCLVGIGATLSVAPLTTVVLNSAPAAEGGTASGINNAAARLGGLIAVAALGFAFGGMDLSRLEDAVLLNAYRWVMIASTCLAVLSAAVAWSGDFRSAARPQ